ncbi:hypothetical protein ABZ490_23570 [Streptomyces sp. NPDC005811]|uniref:hypothetical protein n=1 Tax=Streptomyces sp. NPDC005811 TaxID=3154565 RepID=UPI00340C9063
MNTISPGLVDTSGYSDPDGTVARWTAASGMSLADFRRQLVKGQNVTTGRMAEPIDGGTLKTV